MHNTLGTSVWETQTETGAMVTDDRCPSLAVWSKAGLQLTASLDLAGCPLTPKVGFPTSSVRGTWTKCMLPSMGIQSSEVLNLGMWFPVIFLPGKNHLQSEAHRWALPYLCTSSDRSVFIGSWVAKDLVACSVLVDLVWGFTFLSTSCLGVVSCFGGLFVWDITLGSA